MRAPAYDQSLYDIVRRLVDIAWAAVRGRRVVIKPNLVEFEPGSRINTHPMLVHAACEAFRALGAARCDRRRPWASPQHAGPGRSRRLFQTVPGLRTCFVDLNLDEVTRVDLPRQFSSSRSSICPIPCWALPICWSPCPR